MQVLQLETVDRQMTWLMSSNQMCIFLQAKKINKYIFKIALSAFVILNSIQDEPRRRWQVRDQPIERGLQQGYAVTRPLLLLKQKHHHLWNTKPSLGEFVVKKKLNKVELMNDFLKVQEGNRTPPFAKGRTSLIPFESSTYDYSETLLILWMFLAINALSGDAQKYSWGSNG